LIGPLPPPPAERRDRAFGFVGGFNAGDLDWAPWERLQRKLLSFDSTSGAVTQLVRSAGPGELSTGLEEDVLLVVLTGSARVGAAELGRFGYAALAAGGRVELRSEAGFEALWLGFGSESRSSGSVPAGDLVAEPWRTSGVPGLPSPLPPGLLVKPIRHDSRGGLVFLSGSLLRRMVDARWESHPCSEEQVYLGGEFTQMESLRSGVTRLDYVAGGYSFRPPGIWHLGPGSGTDSYCLRIVRTTETLVNNFDDAAGPYPDAYRW
jgi:hypothetical protein